MRFEEKEIDRGIVLRLQKVIADLGYWPNIDSFMPEPIDQVAFKAAIDAIRTAKKELIEVFNPASPNDRLETENNHIVVKRRYFDDGTIGYGSTSTYRDNGDNTFDRILENQPVNIEYEIRFVCSNSFSHQLMDKIIFKAFGMRRYVYGGNEDRTLMDEGFEFFKNGIPTDIESGKHIERLYRYVVTDVVIADGEVIDENIPKVVEISLGISPQEELTTEEAAEQIDDSEFIFIDIIDDPES